jgi:Ran GTPase-activating protein (RanGAP) involved in mRNA processing and transport
MQRLRVEDGLLLAAVLQSNQEITALNARDNDMAFGGQQAIVALGKACENHTMLTSLDLSRNYIKNEGFKAIHGLVRKDRLTSLSLNANQINSEAVGWVAKACQCDSTLTALDLSDNDLVVFNDDYVKVDLKGLVTLLGSLKKNKLLNAIDLSRNQIGGWKDKSELTDLAEYLHVTSTLMTIRLAGNSLNESDAIQLSGGLKGNKTITQLDLADNRICVRNQTGLCKLAESMRGGNIKYLNLSKNALCGVQHIPGTRDDEASRVAALLPHKRQTDMGTYRTEGMAILCEVLADAQQIISLNLSCNKLHVRGVGLVAGLVGSCASLRTLNLSHTTMTLDRKSAHEHAMEMDIEARKAADKASGKRKLWQVGKRGVLGMLRAGTAAPSAGGDDHDHDHNGNGNGKGGGAGTGEAIASKKPPVAVPELFTEERSYTGLSALCDAMKRNPSATVLDLSGNQLMDKGLHIFAELLHVGR